MKTIASFIQPMDAHLLRSRLESCGIPSYLRDENTIALDWLYAQAIGGIKIDVADEDYDRALEILGTDTSAPGDHDGDEPPHP